MRRRKYDALDEHVVWLECSIGATTTATAQPHAYACPAKPYADMFLGHVADDQAKLFCI